MHILPEEVEFWNQRSRWNIPAHTPDNDSDISGAKNISNDIVVYGSDHDHAQDLTPGATPVRFNHKPI